jgi:hypothetical protein
MQRRFTSQRHFRTVHQENARIAERRAADLSTLGPRQKAKLHQPPGITFWRVNRGDTTLLA